jgi:imidazolonepropionase-like amidohydrolase
VSRPVALAADRLATGDGAVLEDAAVVLDGGRVRAVGTRTVLAPLLAEADVREHPGCTILPGLIDAHVHVSFTGDGRSYAAMMAEPDELLACLGVEHADAHLRMGVTTMRDLGERGGTAIAVRRYLSARARPAARMLVAGRPVTPSGGHMHWCGGAADGEDEIRRTIRTLAGEGVDCIKLVGSGGGTPNTRSWLASYTVAELRAAVETANGLGLPTAAHCHATRSIENAAIARVGCIEHVSFLSHTSGPVRQEGASWSGLVAEYDPRVVEVIAEAGCHLGMTLLGGYAAVLRGRARTGERGADEERRIATAGEHFARKLGVFSRLTADGLADRLVVSTDAGAGDTVFGQLHLALAAAVEGGFTPLQAIESATRVAADACGVAGETGVLGEGLAADVLVVAGDATREIGALADVRAVWRAGIEVGAP